MIFANSSSGSSDTFIFNTLHCRSRLKFRESKPVDAYRSFAPAQDDKTMPEAVPKRMFRRELQRKRFIFKESELPEGLKPVFVKCVIELPAEA